MTTWAPDRHGRVRGRIRESSTARAGGRVEALGGAQEAAELAAVHAWPPRRAPRADTRTGLAAIHLALSAEPKKPQAVHREQRGGGQRAGPSSPTAGPVLAHP